MTNLDSILKSQGHYFANEGLSSQIYGFPVVMYGCESWAVKKAERWRIDIFELMFWRRFLRVLWTARRSNQSILMEISAEYSLEGVMLKLKLQYLDHLMWRADSFEKTLMLGKIEGWRRRGQQRMRWLDGGHEFEWTPRVGDGQGSWRAVIHGVAKSQMRLNWTELNWTVAQIMNSLLPNSDLNWRKWGKPLDHSGMT